VLCQCGEREVDQAIDVVGKARNDMLTHMLIDFLMGETDGVPKDPNYIYRLYMALGNFAQVRARTYHSHCHLADSIIPGFAEGDTWDRHAPEASEEQKARLGRQTDASWLAFCRRPRRR
jgi:hypothetical protein